MGLTQSGKRSKIYANTSGEKYLTRLFSFSRLTPETGLKEHHLQTLMAWLNIAERNPSSRLIVRLPK